MIEFCSALFFLAFSESVAFDKKLAMDSLGLAQVGTSGIEFFQILLDGCWLAAVYPNSHEDSNVTYMTDSRRKCCLHQIFLFAHRRSLFHSFPIFLIVKGC